MRCRGVILGAIRFVVGGGNCGEVVGLFLIRGVEVGGLKKAVKAFLCFSCSPELSCTDFDFFDLCCFCFFDFVGGRVVSSSPNLDESLLTSGYLVRNSSMVNPLDEVGECPAVVTSATVLPLSLLFVLFFRWFFRALCGLCRGRSA